LRNFSFSLILRIWDLLMPNINVFQLWQLQWFVCCLWDWSWELLYFDSRNFCTIYHIFCLHYLDVQDWMYGLSWFMLNVADSLPSLKFVCLRPKSHGQS
jgi:hypothetical protein